jgi:phosphoribosylaminoimidazolecarboxamide formyltransferase/IMP cyclohydrolase
VAIITAPDQYPLVSEALANGGFSPDQRQRLAAIAFAHTAAYDVAVANWMGTRLSDTSAGDSFPAWLGCTWDKVFTLRYGENSHQRAALYRGDGSWGLGAAEQLHGKEMSYNNYTDADAAYRAVYDFSDPCVAIIKHANPCGIAIGDDIADAHRKAHACDPVSAFGGVVAANRPLSAEAAGQLAEIFTEVIIAPGFEEGALEQLTKKKNLRILRVDAYPRGWREADGWRELRPISGGLLVQDADQIDAPGDDWSSWRLVAGEPADEQTMADLRFAWRACRCVKSNAILLANSGASVGVGMGQVNRVDSCRLAVSRAGDRAAGAVAASDAVFPFDDGPKVLIDAGVRAIIQPGGSVRDQDTIAAAKAAGVTMYFTGTRHFFH